jgi:pimeloyl-ACP methyl ester carboxylesterase
MPILEREGARISYEVAGQGPPVILGHSLLCDSHMWDAVVPALATNHRVINVDARGHGASRSGGAFTLEDLAADWIAILDREGIERAALVGLSMGGMTAMRLALESPERVAGLALLDTSADSDTAAHRVQYRIMAEATRFAGHLKVLEGTLNKVMFGRTSLRTRRELVARQVDRWRAHPPRLIYHAARAVMDRRPVLERLGAIDCPTLVLVGDEDAALSPACSRRIAGAIRGAELVVVPGAGHLTALEAPEAVVTALVRFLTRCDFGGPKRTRGQA